MFAARGGFRGSFGVLDLGFRVLGCRVLGFRCRTEGGSSWDLLWEPQQLQQSSFLRLFRTCGTTCTSKTFSGLLGQDLGMAESNRKGHAAKGHMPLASLRSHQKFSSSGHKDHKLSILSNILSHMTPHSNPEAP